MWGLVIALATVGGLVRIAFHEAVEPTIRPAVMRMRLARLARMPADRLTLDQAEDGMVLSRRLGEEDLGRRFAEVAAIIKAHRSRTKENP
jgi:hypothetical protein